MSSWGATDADESKPKYLTTEEKRKAYSTTKGWVYPAAGNDNASADAEVLVAIGGLSGATKLNIADISSVNWNITAFDKSDGGTISVTVNYNEQVDVTGTPQLTVTNDTPSRNVTLDYASGTGTNRLTFTKAIAAANAATNSGDVLSIGANAVALNSGTVKEKGSSTNATITHSAVSTTITVVA
jgi:hypothetical protein